jgi:hypothetical protein
LETDDNRDNEVVAMIAILVASGNSFKLVSSIIDIVVKEDGINKTRQERERLVLELYNQGKTVREIAKEVRISFRDIGIILNKTLEEKTEASKEQRQDNNNGVVENNQQEPHLSLAAQAYKLFSEHKTPLQVAIALNRGESEVTKFYREYWKLKQLHILNMVYEELKGNIDSFLKLHKLSKAKGMGVKQVVNLLQIANNDLPVVERRFKRLRNEISMLQFQRRIDKRNLYQLNNQIASTTKLLSSYRLSCIRERREIEILYNEKTRLEVLVTGFKNNNEEYLNKIKQAAYEVKSVLNDSKLLLKFATLSVIESLRMNSELCNFVLNDISNNNDDVCTAVILEESEKLYNTLITKLNNEVIAVSAAAIRKSSLSTPLSDNDKQI